MKENSKVWACLVVEEIFLTWERNQMNLEKEIFDSETFTFEQLDLEGILTI